MDSNFDNYIWGLTEQGHEPEMVDTCEHCGAELYEGEEAVVDGGGNYFCDYSCAGHYYGIKEADYLHNEEYTCEHCGEAIAPEEHEAYMNKYNEIFCCEECAEEDAQIENITMKMEE